MKKKTAFIIIAKLVSILIISMSFFPDRSVGEEKGGMTLIPVNIYGADEKGIYYSDPITWIRNDYNVLIYDLKFSVRAQVFDQNGHKMSDIISYDVPELRVTGNMFLFNPTFKCQKASIKKPQAIMSNTKYEVNVKAGAASQTIIAHFSPAKCDRRGCHPNTPPNHVLEKKSKDGVKSRCNNCHNLALKIHPKHYNIVSNDSIGCFKCHSNSGCSIGLSFEITYNPHSDKTCIDCHGTLYDSTKGSFKMKRQRGLPRCDDCHDKEYSYYSGDSFHDSYGHGGVACINCHASTHLGNHTSIGFNACASACHTTQPNDSKMGPMCGKCHNSSIAPHQVKR